MYNPDDLCILERYQQVNELFGYKYSGGQRLLGMLGSKQAQGKVEVEKQANELLGQLKTDAARAGYKSYEDAAKDLRWIVGWLSNNIGVQLAGDKAVQQSIVSNKKPFEIIKTAINQAHRLQYTAGQAPQQYQAPVQQAPVQQAPVQQAPVQQAPVQQGTKSTQASKLLNTIKSLTPGEIAYIKQNLP